MNNIEHGNSFLVAQFREFYKEVFRLKQRITKNTAVLSNNDDSTVVAGSFSNEIWQRLVVILEKQQATAAQLGGEYWSAYEEAKYVMVALADEIFLQLDWEGRHAWNFNLLESRLFQSHVAGEVFFQRIDQLLHTRSGMRVEVAKVYLIALALGFQGKYRGADPEHALTNYRNRLHSYITLGSDDIGSGARHLFPQAYDHTLNGGEAMRLPPTRRWIIILATVIVAILGISHLLWKLIVSDLQPVLDKIYP